MASPTAPLTRSDSPDHAEEVLDEVRREIAASDVVLKEARRRRELVLEAAARFEGALRTFGSGSVAHRTVNHPVLDADGGVALDRRSHWELGPDGDGAGPGKIVSEVAELVLEAVREEVPIGTVTTTKRAILVEFGERLEDQDPSVDLIVALTRKDAPGLWIPHLWQERWDASHPEKHTELLTADPTDVRVHRARVVRLAKTVIKGDPDPVVSSFHLEALALEHVTEVGTLGESLHVLFAQGASELERRGETPDPAGVSEPMRPLVANFRAVQRLGAVADLLNDALERRDDETAVRETLAKVFPTQIDAPEANRKLQITGELRRGAPGPVVSSALGSAMAPKPVRSSGGDDPAA